jgi:hypothetical protein
MEVIKNDSYNYTVRYVRVSNGEEYQLVGKRLTSTGGAAFDGNGKCLQPTWLFGGWELREQRIVRDGQRVIDLKGQMWKRSDGSRFNVRKFRNKMALEEWIINYVEKHEKR